jgi:KR domain
LNDFSWVGDLRRLGTSIEVVSADISKKHELVNSLYAATYHKLPKIGGVFLGSKQDSSEDDTTNVLNIHASALANLNEVFSNPYPGFFVAFSTVSRVTGSSDVTSFSAAATMVCIVLQALNYLC